MDQQTTPVTPAPQPEKPAEKPVKTPKTETHVYQPEQAKQGKSKTWLWILLVLLVLFVLGIGGCGTCIYLGYKSGSDEIKGVLENVNSVVADYESITTTNENTNYNLDTGVYEYTADQVVAVDNVQWEIIEVENLGKTLYGSESKYPTITENKVASTGYNYILVTIQLENLGTETLTISGPILYDEYDYQYEQLIDVTSWIPAGQEYYMDTDLLVGTPRTVSFMYEILDDVTDLDMYAWGLDYFSEDEIAFIDIGEF